MNYIYILDVNVPSRGSVFTTSIINRYVSEGSHGVQWHRNTNTSITNKTNYFTYDIFEFNYK